MQTIAFVILCLIIFWFFLRFGPVDNERWHVDPADTDQKRRYEVRLLGPEAPRFAADANTLLGEVRAVMKAEPRTRLIGGSEAEGMLTFLVRTPLGYRDFTTFKAVDETEGAKLAIYSRPGLNVYDWGVNAKRVDRWVKALEQRVAR